MVTKKVKPLSFLVIIGCLTFQYFCLDDVRNFSLPEIVATQQLSVLDQSSASLECRLKWDLKKKANLTNIWLEMELPILVTAIRHHRGDTNEDHKFYGNTQKDMVYIILTQRHSRQYHKVVDFNSMPWVCLYGRETTEDRINDNDDDRQHPLQNSQEVTTFPKDSKGSNQDRVIILCNSTMENSTLVLKGVSPTVLPKQRPKPFVYDLEEPLKCDGLEEQETTDIHDKKKIGACLRFKGEFDRSIVPEWIEYHRILGIEHFWIYINEEFNLTGLFNRSYITYMPFDLNWNNHASHFEHHYNDYKPKISQEPASWSCMFNAKKFGYDWLTTTDVDEYIRVPKIQNETIVSALPPLQSYLTRYNPNNYSCLQLNSVPFGRNKWLKHPDFPSNPLLINYVWRRNIEFSEYPLYRYKQIYNPQNVWSSSVHKCGSADRKKVVVKTQDGLFLQHYKLAHMGVYKKFEKLMLKSEDQLLRDSTLSDMYRLDLANALQKLDSTLLTIAA